MKVRAIGSMIAFLTMLMPAAGVLAEDCTSVAVSAVQTGERSYDPADTRPLVLSIQIERMAPDDSKACDAGNIEIRSASGDAIVLRGASGQIESRPFRSRGLVQAGAGFALDAEGNREWASSGRVLLQLLEIAPGQFLAPGEYWADLVVSSEGRPTEAFRIGLTVVPSIALLSGDGHQTLSLGDITDGSRISADFLYRTNASVTLSATSESRGELVHQLGSTYGGVPYAAWINGQRLDLAGAATLTLPQGGASERMGRLDIEVMPQHSAVSGIYRDVLVISLIAN
jgi:hypothetical protein